MTAVLVCGGTVSAAFLKEKISEIEDAKVYAVDGGLTICDAAGIVPDYMIGDFDTAASDLVLCYSQKCKVFRHPPEKDATDTELAMELAISEGMERIVLLGATGTRLDHTLANVHMLYYAMVRGVSAEILDEHNRITLHDRSFCVTEGKRFGTYISFLPFAGTVSKLTLSGVKYELNGYDLNPGTSICVSNEPVSERISVNFETGILLMFQTRD